MNARSWFVLALGTLVMPSAYAAVRGDHGVPGDPAMTAVVYLATDTRSSLALSSDFSGMTSPIDGDGVTAAFPFAAAKLAHPDIRIQQAQFAALGDHGFAGDRGWERSALRGDTDSSGNSSAMTALDLGLMMLFAFGLVAYQLDRKQRLLRQSALIPTSLERSQAVVTAIATRVRDSTVR